jgi:hypothetical protein
MLALIGPGRSNDQRDAIAIDEQREFRAFFGSSGNCVPTVIQEWSGTGFIQLTRT